MFGYKFVSIANVRKVNVNMARHPFFLILSPSLPFPSTRYPFYFVFIFSRASSLDDRVSYFEANITSN